MISSELDFSEIAIRQKIHFGCFGTVYKTFHRGFNRALRNVKINNKFHSDLGPMNQLKGLDHPNITRFYEIKINHQSELNLITEYVDGSTTLHTVIHTENQKHYSTAETWAWSWQITKALRYLHSNEILHKDLRPRNILITADYTKIKLCDFGPIFDLRKELTGIEGSLPYMAPELFDCLPHTEKSDVYSLAITLWELFSRERPYSDVKVRIAIPYFVKMQSKRPTPLKDCPEQIVSLLHKSWSTNSINRPSIEEIEEKFSPVE